MPGAPPQRIPPDPLKLPGGFPQSIPSRYVEAAVQADASMYLGGSVERNRRVVSTDHRGFVEGGTRQSISPEIWRSVRRDPCSVEQGRSLTPMFGNNPVSCAKSQLLCFDRIVLCFDIPSVMGCDCYTLVIPVSLCNGR